MSGQRDRGFTLIEVMIVVAIIGILAAIAIPAFMSYMRKSKASEGVLNLNKIAKNLKSEYQKDAQFPVGTSAVLPTNPGSGSPGKNCCYGNASSTAKDKCPANASEFATDAMWKEIEFVIGEPTQYQYQYIGQLKAATVYAIGDLDCNGVSATYTMAVVGGGPAEPVSNLTEPPKGVY